MRSIVLFLFVFVVFVSSGFEEEWRKYKYGSLEYTKEKGNRNHNPFGKKFVLDEFTARYPILREEFLSRNWTEGHKESTNYDFKWTWCNSRLGTPRSNQIVNHFSNFYQVDSKKNLIINLRHSPLSFDFFPRSYLIESGNSSDGRNSFLDDCLNIDSSCDFEDNLFLQQTCKTSRSQPLIDGLENLWIAKPSEGTRGVGITLWNNCYDLLASIDSSNSRDFAVQKYVETPLLIFGKKFDIRQFVLVTSLDPLIVFMYDDCYLRFCSHDYSNQNIQDKYAHLTNHQVQKDVISQGDVPKKPDLGSDESNGDVFAPEGQWTLKRFQAYMHEMGLPLNHWEMHLRPRIETLIFHSLSTWIPPPEVGRRSFELLGFDIMLAYQQSEPSLEGRISPWLIEINANPGLHPLTKVATPHHEIAQRDLLKIVIDHRDLWELQRPVKKSPQFGNWSVIVWNGQLL